MRRFEQDFTQEEKGKDRQSTPFSNSTPKTQGLGSSISWVPHFQCDQCQTEFPLKARSLDAEVFRHRCPVCSSAIVLRSISQSEDWSITEIEGAKYRGLDVEDRAQDHEISNVEEIQKWISSQAEHSEKTKIVPSELSKAQAFVTDFINTWEIKTSRGRTYQFQYFSEIRTWIQEGKFTAEDSITPSEGTTSKLAEYPGTADLFGNHFPRAHARGLHGNRAPKYSFPEPKKASSWTLAFLLGVSLIGIALPAFQAFRIWVGKKADSFTATLTLSYPKEFDISKEDSLLLGHKEYLKQNFGAAREYYLYTLQSQDKDTRNRALASLLAMNLENGVLSSEISSRDEWLFLSHLRLNASKLSESSFALAAADRKAKDLNKAVKKLDREKKRGSQNPLVIHRAAQYAYESNDLDLAAIHLNYAIQNLEDNLSFHLLLAEVFKNQGKALEAAQTLRRAEAQHPNLDLSKDILNLMLQTSDNEGIELAFRTSLKRNPSDDALFSKWLDHLEKVGDQESLLSESLVFLAQFRSSSQYSKVESRYQNLVQLSQGEVVETGSSLVPSHVNRRSKPIRKGRVGFRR